jgi:chemotaxis protein MotA
MDLATVLGFVAAVVIFVFGIISGGAGLMIYVNIPSVLVTFGGSIACTVMANPLSSITSVPKYISKAMNVPNFQEEKIISTLVNFSERAGAGPARP